MPPRVSAQTAEEVAPEVTPEVVAEVVPEIISEPATAQISTESSNPFFVQHVEEPPMFLEKWASLTGGVSAEVLGTFVFIARQQNWIVDTPSGWQNKLSSWINNN